MVNCQSTVNASHIKFSLFYLLAGPPVETAEQGELIKPKSPLPSHPFHFHPTTVDMGLPTHPPHPSTPINPTPQRHTVAKLLDPDG